VIKLYKAQVPAIGRFFVWDDMQTRYGRGMTWPHALQVRCTSLSKKRA